MRDHGSALTRICRRGAGERQSGAPPARWRRRAERARRVRSNASWRAGRDLLARFRPVFSVAARAGRRSTDPRANEPIVFPVWALRSDRLQTRQPTAKGGLRGGARRGLRGARCSGSCPCAPACACARAPPAARAAPCLRRRALPPRVDGAGISSGLNNFARRFVPRAPNNKI